MHNDPSGDWSAGTNKKGLGEIHQTNSGVTSKLVNYRRLHS